ncbi:hypothetical protein ACIBTP_42115 [Streptomyces avidinii]|uniref:hypothetical protein n=1 Tax=Streptomyces avidinii TaxID=1895 RepID=UPI00379E4001
MLGTVTEVLDGAMDVLTVALGLGCVWLGSRVVLRPRQPPESIRGPLWAVRAWGLGFVLLGIPLSIETGTLLTGGASDWAADVIRWVAGPLVVGSIVAAVVARRRERQPARTVKGGRWA